MYGFKFQELTQLDQEVPFCKELKKSTEGEILTCRDDEALSYIIREITYQDSGNRVV